MRKEWLILTVTMLAGCAGLQSNKTSVDVATEQCAYGAIVPRQVITYQQRQAYLRDVAIPSCLKAKGYVPADVASNK